MHLTDTLAELGIGPELAPLFTTAIERSKARLARLRERRFKRETPQFESAMIHLNFLGVVDPTSHEEEARLMALHTAVKKAIAAAPKRTEAEHTNAHTVFMSLWGDESNHESIRLGVLSILATCGEFCDDDTLDDITQDTWLVLWRKVEKFAIPGTASLQTRLSRLAQFQAKAFKQKMIREKRNRRKLIQHELEKESARLGVTVRELATIN